MRWLWWRRGRHRNGSAVTARLVSESRARQAEQDWPAVQEAADALAALVEQAMRRRAH